MALIRVKENRGSADFLVCAVSSRGVADLLIYYVSSRGSAGWNNQNHKIKNKIHK